MKRMRIWLIIALFCGAAIIGYHVIGASGILYSYGQRGIVDLLTNGAGSHLYVSYYLDNAVVEIDTTTMNELRRFTVVEPTMMQLQPDGTYLYVISLWPGKVTRIRLADGQQQSISVDGEGCNLAFDPSGQRLWVVHRTWPVRGEVVDPANKGPHPDTGFISQISTASLDIDWTAGTSKLPMTAWYAPVSNRLYVYHELTDTEFDGSAATPDLRSSVIEMGDMLSVYSLNEETPRYLHYIVAGLYDSFDDMPISIAPWSDDGRYFAVPSMEPPVPEFSVRVFDAMDDTVLADISIPGEGGLPVDIADLQKVPGADVLWVAIKGSRPPLGLDPDGRYVARINTQTMTSEVYEVAEANSYLGNFAVSPDGSKLYLSQPDTGDIIVWSP